MTFIDTNYFLRFLLADVSEQHQQARKLFQQGGSGKVQLFTSLVVLFEVFWVFTSFYKKSKQETIGILRSILSLSFIELENKKILEEALKIYSQTTLELEDCYNVAYARQQQAKKFMTFDKKLSEYLEVGH